MNNAKYFLLVLIALMVASLACGSVQVGIVAPTEETGIQPTNQAQAPEPELAVIDDVESQIVEQPSPEPTEQAPVYSIPTLAYIGPDNNVWVLEAGSETPRQLTFDANLGGEGTTVEYMSPSLSFDGTFMAYSLLVSTPSDNGYDSTYGLWVMNLATGEQHQVMESRAAGYAWQPGTHLLAFGTGQDLEYFISRSDPDFDLATGISAINLENGEIVDLVAPERGYALANPNWSPDGRFLAFSEVDIMEGSGMFAYYDLEIQEYFAWDEKLGSTSWSPNGGLLAYDRIIYVPTGEERLYVRPRQGSEQLLGPNYDGPAFASQPLFSPAGDKIAYLAHLEGPMTFFASIMVLDQAGGESKSLGQFEDVWELAWAPDGSHVVFSFGPYPSRQIIAIAISDGSQTMLAEGSQPALAGQ